MKKREVMTHGAVRRAVVAARRRQKMKVRAMAEMQGELKKPNQR